MVSKKYKAKKRSRHAVISFRLTIEEKAALEEIALFENTTITGLSRLTIKSLISNKLQGEFDKRDIATMREDNKKLLEALAVGIEALLVMSGKVKKSDALEWVNREIRG